MKIISFNIGINIDNSILIGEYLKTQGADIICLQEAIRPLDSTSHHIYRSAETIKKILDDDYSYYFFAPEWVANKHKKRVSSSEKETRDFGGMVEQGKLILSKYPITHGYNFFYNKDYEFDCDRTNFYEGDDHGRALQVVEIDVNGRTIQVANVHGLYSSDKLDSERSIEQSRFIIEKLSRQNLLTILLGDFNVLPETESIAIISQAYTNVNKEFSIKSTRPDGKTIDYVFLSKELKPKSLIAEITNISDHYPIILEIEDF